MVACEGQSADSAPGTGSSPNIMRTADCTDPFFPPLAGRWQKRRDQQVKVQAGRTSDRFSLLINDRWRSLRHCSRPTSGSKLLTKPGEDRRSELDYAATHTRADASGLVHLHR